MDRKLQPLLLGIRLLLSILLPLCGYMHGGPLQCRTCNMSDLLRPQLRFPVILNIPDFSFDADVRNQSPALNQAIAFLVAEQDPFRLVLNQNNTQAAPLVSRLSRHLENQVVNLVFAVVDSATPFIDLYNVLISAADLRNQLTVSHVLYKDVTQKIVDQSAGSSNVEVDDSIARKFFQIYLLLWDSENFVTSDGWLLQDTCNDAMMIHVR